MIEVDVWTDVRCPWCWMGLRRLYRAVAELEGKVQVRHRSFLLEPDGPVSPGLTTARVATSEWGLTLQRWQSKSQRIRAEGRKEGLEINVDSALMFDSTPVHRILKYATSSVWIDTEAAWDEAFATHFTRNENLADLSVLREMASGWGLSDEEIECALSDERLGNEIAQDVSDAHNLGVNSVPTIVSADGRHLAGSVSTDDIGNFLSLGASER